MTITCSTVRRLPADLKGPEWLVGVGFRCWMAGYQTGDIACWEQAWNIYASEFGPAKARTAMTDLSCWVRKIRELSGREIETYPAGCHRFCRDECIAVAMVAASQHKLCPALRACTYALLGVSAVEGALAETETLAETLSALDRRLAVDTIQLATQCLACPSESRH